jgi:hypothetical protein
MITYSSLTEIIGSLLKLMLCCAMPCQLCEHCIPFWKAPYLNMLAIKAYPHGFYPVKEEVWTPEIGVTKVCVSLAYFSLHLDVPVSGPFIAVSKCQDMHTRMPLCLLSHEH